MTRQSPASFLRLSWHAARAGANVSAEKVAPANPEGCRRGDEAGLYPGFIRRPSPFVPSEIAGAARAAAGEPGRLLEWPVSFTVCRMPKASSSSAPLPATPLPDSYEAGVQELDQLVAALEGGQLPLDQLLVSYQRGAALLAFCRERLQAVEDQIQVLDAGVLKPWQGA